MPPTAAHQVELLLSRLFCFVEGQGKSGTTRLPAILDNHNGYTIKDLSETAKLAGFEYT